MILSSAAVRPPWHSLAFEEVLERTRASAQGLSPGGGELWRGGLRGNPRLLVVVIAGILLQVALPHIGWLERVLAKVRRAAGR